MIEIASELYPEKWTRRNRQVQNNGHLILHEVKKVDAP